MLARENTNRFRHGRSLIDQRHAITGMHDIADQCQASPQLAAGMKHLEIARCEIARLEKRNGKGIAQRQLHQCGGRRCKSERAGFLLIGNQQHNI
ncbi:hypothetical protein D3C72_1766050 [compost metagenome]